MLTWSIIAQSVVDLPDPVGPVTSTRPLCSLHRERIAGDRPSCSAVRILLGITRNTAPFPLRSMKIFARNRARPGISYAVFCLKKKKYQEPDTGVKLTERPDLVADRQLIPRPTTSGLS